MSKKKPNAEEARGRRFAKLMEQDWNFKFLTVEQANQVIKMAARLTAMFRTWDRDAAKTRGDN